MASGGAYAELYRYQSELEAYGQTVGSGEADDKVSSGMAVRKEAAE